MKRIVYSIILLILSSAQYYSFAQDNLPAGSPADRYGRQGFLDILSEELNRNMTSLKDQAAAPYFISYRVCETKTWDIQASFGNIVKPDIKNKRMLTVMVRVGSSELDNFHELRGDNSGYMDGWSDGTPVAIENEPEAIKQTLWSETNDGYRKATDKFAKVQANVAVKVAAEDKSPDFSKENAEKYIEPLVNEQELGFDKNLWEEKLKKYSAIFLSNPDIYEGSAILKFTIERKYFVSTEGAKIAQNRVAAWLHVSGSIQADDGMKLPLHKTYFALNPKDLPKDDDIISDTKNMVEKLGKLKIAPVVDAYTGPALLSASASGVFFHEIFGHRVEGQRMKKESDAQTFKKKIGQSVLPADISVLFDPTIKNYKGFDLNGSYIYDDEGIKGQKVTIVDKGILKGFLMARCPIENFPNSNGHSRADAGKQPVTRQSNLIVETSKPYTMEQLKTMLKEEAKKQSKEYGYLFNEVTGGFTMTGRFIPNAFNVMPTEVYRVYVDGRPDELVRGVDLVGTPLAMFSQIAAAGDKAGVFTGTCGAESGWVPTTCVSPSLFVKQIEMQRKSKNQNRPPILTRP
ncbi:MAG: TldD/PmbA family protein [Bacteroidia bacterium]|nr:TldD/PmbA family protein [Bacteroidia bacterium]